MSTNEIIAVFIGSAILVAAVVVVAVRKAPTITNEADKVAAAAKAMRTYAEADAAKVAAAAGAAVSDVSKAEADIKAAGKQL